jgi:uncharacterized protein with ParB-like and HNH nuclease domain
LESLSGSDEEQIEARDIKEAEKAETEKRKHYPNQKSPYKLVLYVLQDRKEGDKWLGFRDWLYIKRIRQASNVSTQFRLELGKAL